MRDLSAHLRHLFVVQTLGEVPDSFSVTAEHTDRLASQAERISQGEILRAIDFLAAAIAAVKDGSEPRIQLEVALLKATQPQADLSLQALMFRIEQLEERLGGRPAGQPRQPPAVDRAAAAAVAAPRGSREPRWQPAPAVAPPSPSRARGLAAGGRARASTSLVALWPAVAETVAEENGMLGAALEAARPIGVEGDRLTIAFPTDAAFVRKKAEANRELVAGAVRGLTGQSEVSAAFELNERHAAPAAPATLDHDQLIERLRDEFGAEEVFDEPDEEKR